MYGLPAARKSERGRETDGPYKTDGKNNRAWFEGQCFAGHAYDPEFDEIAQRFLCGDVLNHGTLTDKQRALILLTALGRSVKPESHAFTG